MTPSMAIQVQQRMVPIISQRDNLSGALTRLYASHILGHSLSTY